MKKIITTIIIFASIHGQASTFFYENTSHTTTRWPEFCHISKWLTNCPYDDPIKPTKPTLFTPTTTTYQEHHSQWFELEARRREEQRNYDRELWEQRNEATLQFQERIRDDWEYRQSQTDYFNEQQRLANRETIESINRRFKEDRERDQARAELISRQYEQDRLLERERFLREQAIRDQNRITQRQIWENNYQLQRDSIYRDAAHWNSYSQDLDYYSNGYIYIR